MAGDGNSTGERHELADVDRSDVQAIRSASVQPFIARRRILRDQAGSMLARLS
jgi:hypothetical protein